MNKLPKEKRNHLILVILGTGILLAGLYFGLIQYQQDSLGSLKAKAATERKKQAEMDIAIKNGKALDTQLEQASNTLAASEENMASGDPYLWMVNTIRQFQPTYKVELPQISTISVGQMTLLPRFPYKQLSITVGGTAYYHDLGQFIAGFENRFPEMRIQNLDVQPPGTARNSDRDKLTFKMDIVALVKSTSN